MPLVAVGRGPGHSMGRLWSGLTLCLWRLLSAKKLALGPWWSLSPVTQPWLPVYAQTQRGWWPGLSSAWPWEKPCPAVLRAVLSLVLLAGPCPDSHLEADILAQLWPLLREVPSAWGWGCPLLHADNMYTCLSNSNICSNCTLLASGYR